MAFRWLCAFVAGSTWAAPAGATQGEPAKMQAPVAPRYGAPGYGPPNYGAPGYGAPGYGQPGYGAPPSPYGPYAPSGPPPPTADPRIEKERREREEETLRAGEHLALTADLFLFQLVGGGVGATLGVHLAGNTLLEASGYVASSLAPSMESASLAVRLQQFFAARNYVSIGARVRRVEHTSDAEVFDDELDERIVQDDVGIDFAVGSQWRPGKMVLGVDWAGVYVPLHGLSTKTAIVDPLNGEVLDERVREVARLVDVRILHLHVGGAF